MKERGFLAFLRPNLLRCKLLACTQDLLLGEAQGGQRDNNRLDKHHDLLLRIWLMRKLQIKLKLHKLLSSLLLLDVSLMVQEVFLEPFSSATIQKMKKCRTLKHKAKKSYPILRLISKCNGCRITQDLNYFNAGSNHQTNYVQLQDSKKNQF